jgi:hypothetical protein
MNLTAQINQEKEQLRGLQKAALGNPLRGGLMARGGI